MPLVQHLKLGMDAKKPPGWHRNEERRAHQEAPVAQLLTDFDEWETSLIYSESLILTGTAQQSFKYLAYAWGREIGFHLQLVLATCARGRPFVPVISDPLTIYEDLDSGDSVGTSEQSSRQGSQGRLTPLGEDSSWRRAQMVRQDVVDREVAPKSPTGGSSLDKNPDDRHTSTPLEASEERTDFSFSQLDEVNEYEASDFQNQHGRMDSFAHMSSLQEWTRYDGNAVDSSNGPAHLSGSTEAEKNDQMSDSVDLYDWAQNGRPHDNSTEEARASRASKQHRRTVPPTGTRASASTDESSRMRVGSEEWTRPRIASIGQVDDLDFDTYCLSMQFDDVTLQNIYGE
jgi:hypothetical protein